ncbi:MAG: c-type cytochrome [Alphaproteobacteria bacterium]|nr:c-type cytochrome [Alphaproteobacteria bacterium]MBT4020346.1 c-type cytochrome [Alphaproteobacteria bacterium]MBT5161422.1 c-type cytochrome [Alphaproteobacteria bacterium]
MFAKLITAFLLMVFSFPAFAATELKCPVAPTTPWRTALNEADLKKYVNRRHDGNWSSYIAKWERQIDTARDVLGRKKALIIRIDKSRLPLRGDELAIYITGMEQRVETAYCLAERKRMAENIREIEKLGPAELAKRSVAGKRTAIQAGCQNCHGDQGVSNKPEIPNIGGQRLGYLANQLRAFQKDKSINTHLFGSSMRSEKIMLQSAKNLTPKNKLDIAAYYASLNCGGENNKGTSAPDQPESAKVCIACHGNNGNSISQMVPRLAGQKKVYLVNELRSFRMTKGNSSSFRFNNRRHHQLMSAIAGPLTNVEMRELAVWFSSQTCEK